MTQAQRAREAFTSHHGYTPQSVWSAPGRVNLIGEHTDYNDGFVLPFALPHRTAVAAAPREDGCIVVTTLGDDGALHSAKPVDVRELTPGQVQGWAAYPVGVAWSLREEGIGVRGADLVIAGDVPAGAGLSSSHSLECAVALALLNLSGIPAGEIDTTRRQAIVRWVQRAENDFVGAPTGILDQTASLLCTESHALFFDVRSGEVEQVPFDVETTGLRVLVIDTRASHSHSESGYADRRRGCERAAKLLGINALRDVPAGELNVTLSKLPQELRPLVRHVVTENDRVLNTIASLRDHDLAGIGPLLTASHASMRDDYRISCPELDAAVEAALDEGALGARMTGGGFGGSAIALVTTDSLPRVEQAVRKAFEGHEFTKPRTFTTVPSAGAALEF